MNNLVIGSLAITLGATSVLAGASPPMEQSPGVPTPPAMVLKENAEADNGADPNSSARVTEQKSVGGVPVLIKARGGESEHPLGSVLSWLRSPAKPTGARRGAAT